MVECDAGYSGRDEFRYYDDVCIWQKVYLILNIIQIALAAPTLLACLWHIWRRGTVQKAIWERHQFPTREWLPFVVVGRCVVDIAAQIYRIVANVTMADRTWTYSVLHGVELCFFWASANFILYFISRVFSHMVTSAARRALRMVTYFRWGIWILFIIYAAGTLGFFFTASGDHSYDIQPGYFTLLGSYCFAIGNMFLLFGMGIRRYKIEVETSNTQVVKRTQKRVAVVTWNCWFLAMQACVLSLLIAWNGTVGRYVYILDTCIIPASSYLGDMISLCIFNFGFGPASWRNVSTRSTRSNIDRISSRQISINMPSMSETHLENEGTPSSSQMVQNDSSAVA